MPRPRREFSVKVKKQAWERCNGICENGMRLTNGAPYALDGCGMKIVGRPQYDHIQPDGLQGEPTLDNCQVLCVRCHDRKTHERDRPVMQKADNQRNSAAGIRRTSRPMPGSRRSGLRKRMDGTVERRT